MNYDLRLFPEIYTNGTKPPRYRAIDKKLSMATPAYGFGWVMSKVGLCQKLEEDDDSPMKLWLNYLPEMVGERIWPRWEEKGYDKMYNPVVPEARNVGKDHVLIIMACNESDEVMDSIMANKAYHDECRDCLGSPETMTLEPAWFRVGLRDMPKGFIPGDTKEADDKPPTCACGHRC